MPWLELIALGIVQGATEFLPISSSGHLVIAADLLRMTHQTPLVVVMLHAATLASILVFFRRRIALLLTRDRRLIGPIVIGTLPAAAAGFLIERFLPGFLENPLLASLMLLVTAGVLWWSRRLPAGYTECEDVGYGKALVIGMAQAAAITPGISRSGITIVAGLAVGLRRVAAAEFSFLLAIPVIGGAALLKLIELASESSAEAASVRLGPLLVAMLVAFVVGVISLRWLVHWLKNFRLHYFTWWCGAVGLAAVVYFAARALG